MLMELENEKRIGWPVAEMIEVFSSRDGVFISVKLISEQITKVRIICTLSIIEKLSKIVLGNFKSSRIVFLV